MNALKTTSKILLVVAALSLTAAGCERRAGDQSSGASGSPSSGASGSGAMGSSGSSSGTSGGSGSGSTSSGSGSK